MKLKLKTPQLLYVIIIQIILVDVFLIGVFLSKIGFIPVAAKTSTKADKTESTKNDKAKTSENVKPPQKENPPVKQQQAEIKKPPALGQAPYLSPEQKGDKLKYDPVSTMFARDSYIWHYKPSAYALEPYQSDKKSFVATAYDLSYECCGKYPSHPEFGITYSGVRATKGRTVAVDPQVIPLGSYVHIEFPKEYAHMDGWYVAEDTGNLVKGNIIDVFFGDSAPGYMQKFGRRKITVRIIYPEDVKKLLQKGITYNTISGNK